MSLPPSPLPAALPSGTCLREFVLRHVLGHGGFGIVYLADDTLLGRRVALKEYFPPALAVRGENGQQVGAPPATLTRYQNGLHAFMREARLLARFDHPGLVPVHHYWEANGTAYMVMPYVEGATLKDLVRSLDGPPDEAWLRRVLDGLLDTLEAMHEARVYHRDVSPDNVMVGADGQPVLLDLGAARQVQPDGTQTITALLKPSYAPIEQYAHDRELRQGPWTDLYAVAATMCFALTGQAPPTAAARAVRDLHRPLHERESLRAEPGRRGYDPRWLAALDAALAVKPDDRPRSVAAWRAMLRDGVRPSRPVDRRGHETPGLGLAAPAPAPIGTTGPTTHTTHTTQTAELPPPSIVAGLQAAAQRRLRAPAAGSVTRSWPTSPFVRGGWARRAALLGATALMALLALPGGPPVGPADDPATSLLGLATPRRAGTAGPLASASLPADGTLAPGESMADADPAAQAASAGTDVLAAAMAAPPTTLPTAPPEATAAVAAAVADSTAPAATMADAAIAEAPLAVATADEAALPATTADTAATATTTAAAGIAVPAARHAGRAAVTRAPQRPKPRPRTVAASLGGPIAQCTNQGFFQHWRCMASACADPRWTQQAACREWRGDDRLQASQYRH